MEEEDRKSKKESQFLPRIPVYWQAVSKNSLASKKKGEKNDIKTFLEKIFLRQKYLLENILKIMKYKQYLFTLINFCLKEILKCMPLINVNYELTNSRYSKTIINYNII